MNLSTLILFITFNRPDTAIRIFEERRNQPARLFVVAVGSRYNKIRESELFIEARRITTNINWFPDLFPKFKVFYVRKSLSIKSRFVVYNAKSMYTYNKC